MDYEREEFLATIQFWAGAGFIAFVIGVPLLAALVGAG